MVAVNTKIDLWFAAWFLGVLTIFAGLVFGLPFYTLHTLIISFLLAAETLVLWSMYFEHKMRQLNSERSR